MLAFVFPGQGSQHKGMGGTLFDEFSDLTATADQILGYSIKELCLQDRDGTLTQTQFTQPALYVVNALSYLKTVNETGRKPQMVAGHSLGEYNALFAAGVFDFATGLRLVKRRGELMSKATGGCMAAVIGYQPEAIRKILADNGLDGIDVANYNSPVQTIISGTLADLQRAKPAFEADGKRYLILNVSGAFHSRYMADPAREFGDYLRSFTFAAPKVPVISNVHARPYNPDEIHENLVKQLTFPVRWLESVWYMLSQGDVQIEEIGPGDALKGLVKAIREKYVPTVAMATAAAARMENEPARPAAAALTPATLGDSSFRKEYNVKYAYAAGGMYKGIASKELVVRMAKAGLLSFFGTGGLTRPETEQALDQIQRQLSGGEPYGVNVVYDPADPQTEEETVDLCLARKVRNLEAGAFMSVTPALVRYRLRGLSRDGAGRVAAANRILAKVSRPEVAELFLSPAPERIVEKLLAAGQVTQEQATLARTIAMADDICAEGDSGGHTDQRSALPLIPTILRLRDELAQKYRYDRKIRVGAAGGIGTPEAAAAAFLMGADFILTGSVNQCTMEAGTSTAVKELLQQVNIQDTDYAPAGDMFELGAKVQVLKKGVLFPARAKRLYELYQQLNSIDEIDAATRARLEEKYFRQSIDEVYRQVRAYRSPQEISRAEQNPKYKLALICKWYFAKSTALALSGDPERKVDYQVHCGPALGAFNQWVKGSALEDWRNRHVDSVAEMIMEGAAAFLNRRLQELC